MFGLEKTIFFRYIGFSCARNPHTLQHLDICGSDDDMTWIFTKEGNEIFYRNELPNLHNLSLMSSFARNP